ncbi:MAG: hypothetical protein HC921_13995 [Synechococcaceae cyanobacterium SM2_3_1]|nr:hypothetical protein [Synechococcaceae cyanobacterium SM2_3_1]
MSDRETMLSMLSQGVGLNLSGLILWAGGGMILGPLGWTSTLLAIALKLIGDGQLIRAYWMWQMRHPAPVDCSALAVTTSKA